MQIETILEGTSANILLEWCVYIYDCMCYMCKPQNFNTVVFLVSFTTYIWTFGATLL